MELHEAIIGIPVCVKGEELEPNTVGHITGFSNYDKIHIKIKTASGWNLTFPPEDLETIKERYARDRQNRIKELFEREGL